MSFVNYLPSKERTDHNTNEAIMKYGKDIVIINGEDDWNACKIFHIGFILSKFGIEKVGDFHDGISGITTSGCVIKKADYAKFIKKFNRMKWVYRRFFGPGQMAIIERITIFDPDVNKWIKFFEMRYGDTEYKEESPGCFICRRVATCTINNFKNCKKDVSWGFKSSSTQWYWKKVDKF